MYVCVCPYLSDGLGDTVATAGVCEADGRVQTDLVAHRHVYWFSTGVRAPEGLAIQTHRLV